MKLHKKRLLKEQGRVADKKVMWKKEQITIDRVFWDDGMIEKERIKKVLWVLWRRWSGKESERFLYRTAKVDEACQMNLFDGERSLRKENDDKFSTIKKRIKIREEEKREKEEEAKMSKLRIRMRRHRLKTKNNESTGKRETTTKSVCMRRK
jgi:hypothetical protein